MLILLAKGIVLMVALAVAGAPAGIVYGLTQSMALALTTAAIGLCGVGVAMIFLVAVAFRRFDISSDVPV